MQSAHERSTIRKWREPSERVRRMRARLQRTRPRLCPERAVLVTRAYRATEGRPALERNLLAFTKLLREMTVFISPDELIVGNQASSSMGAPLFPEASADWIEADLEAFASRPQDPFVVPEETRRLLRGILPYWRGKTMEAAYQERISDEVRAAVEAKVIRVKSSGGVGHQLLNIPYVLSKGFLGIGGEIREQMEEARRAGEHEDKLEYWGALLATCEAVIEFAGRYAAEARRQASHSGDPRRRGELAAIAEVCSRVPAHPARGFREVLQVAWFLTLLGHLCQDGGGVTVGRLDQFAFPYLQEDLANGVLSRAEAQELLDCFWLKLQELNVARSSEIVMAWAGYEVNPTVNIGGQNRQGEDVTNELTYMCLEAEAHVHMRNPQLILRIHEDTPERLWQRAVQLLKRGGGKPSFISDAVCTRALQRLGVPEEELRDYSIIGCAEPTVTDARIMLRWAWICLPKVLEIALHDGVDPRTGRRVGPSTGEVGSFRSYAEVLGAYRRQLDHFLGLITGTVNEVADPLVAEQMPHLFFSATTPRCVRTGLDLTQGGAPHNWSVVWAIGPITTANALVALRALSFEGGDRTLPSLLEILGRDFEGQEALRQRMRRLPKFGNDQAEADGCAHEVVSALYEGLEDVPNILGGPFTAGFITLGANVYYGQYVGATPDGRKAGRPLSDGMSPAQGTERNGPTASLKSVAKLDLHRAGSGGILNQRFNPSLLASDRDIGKFIALNKAYLNDLGGLQVQYNVISTETLKDAQQNPEAHSDLLVRVVGYCARFVDLSREVQDDIIARTEHGR